MTNREIDALVAEKVMGWDALETSDGKTAVILPSTQKLFDNIHIFEPSTNISDAWQVVERVEKEFGSFSLTKVIDGGYYCEVLWWNSGAFDVIAEVESKIAPMAICLAALGAKGVFIEENEKAAHSVK